MYAREREKWVSRDILHVMHEQSVSTNALTHTLSQEDIKAKSYPRLIKGPRKHSPFREVHYCKDNAALHS